MKSYIKFLAFIVFITSEITRPSQIIDYHSMPKSIQFTPPFNIFNELLINFTKETAQNDALNNYKKGRFVYRVAVNNLPELKNILAQKSLILSEKIEDKLYELYQKVYDDTKINKNNLPSLSLVSTSAIDIALHLQPKQKPVSNDDLKKVEVLLSKLTNNNEKNTKSSLPYSIQYIKYLLQNPQN